MSHPFIASVPWHANTLIHKNYISNLINFAKIYINLLVKKSCLNYLSQKLFPKKQSDFT